MIDRASRDRMIQVVRSYMAEEIASDEFDDHLTEISVAATDETVEIIRNELWTYYDDMKNHFIVASKQEWDFLNRTLLLLASDAEIKVVASRGPWHVRRVIAAIGLAVYVCLAAGSGFELSSIGLLAFPCCGLSVALAWFNGKRRAVQWRKADALAPFPSIRAMLAVRCSIKGFVRMRYPRALETRRIRGPVVTAFMLIPSATAWLAASPIVLFMQALPDRETRLAMADVDVPG